MPHFDLPALIQDLSNQCHPSGKKVALKQIFLLMVTVSGGSLYVMPAKDYATAVEASAAESISYILGTSTVALVVLYNATDLFLRQREDEKSNLLADFCIVVGSLVSAVPLAAVNFMYPIPGIPKTLLYLQGLVVLFDNTILHFLPIKLALQNPLYRLPALPFEFLFNQLRKICLTTEQRRRFEFQAQKEALFGLLKQRFIKGVDSLLDRFYRSFLFNRRSLSYKSAATSYLSPFYRNSQITLETFDKLMEWAQGESSFQVDRSPGFFRKFLEKLSYLGGATLVTVGCVGYLAAPIKELTELTESEFLATMLSAPSIYFLTVLLAFFGGNSLQGITSKILSGRFSIPMEFKLYPKTTLMLLPLTFYLSLYSYAAAAELIKDNFPESSLREALLIIAKIGLSYLGLTAMMDFWALLLKMFAQFVGSDDAHLSVSLEQFLEKLKNRLEPEQVVQLLSSDLVRHHLRFLLDLDKPCGNEFLLKLKAYQFATSIEHPADTSLELFEKLIHAIDSTNYDNLTPSPASPTQDEGMNSDLERGDSQFNSEVEHLIPHQTKKTFLSRVFSFFRPSETEVTLLTSAPACELS